MLRKRRKVSAKYRDRLKKCARGSLKREEAWSLSRAWRKPYPIIGFRCRRATTGEWRGEEEALAEEGELVAVEGTAGEEGEQRVVLGPGRCILVAA